MPYSPATRRTMYFIGVTTGKSSIMRVFPAWAAHLGLDAVMSGIDFAPNSDPAAYREAVAFLKADPLSLGALVTTHKMTLLKASRELFDDLDPYAQTLGEVSSISKRGDGWSAMPRTRSAPGQATRPSCRSATGRRGARSAFSALAARRWR